MKKYNVDIDETSITGNDSATTVYGIGWYNNKIRENADKRYLLEIFLNTSNIQDNNKILNVIMFNPSESEQNRNQENIFVDKTITNIIKIVNDINNNGTAYNIIKIFNLFPKIDGNPNIIKTDIDKENLNEIKSLKESDVLLAWGAILDERNWIKQLKVDIYKELVDNKNNVFTFCVDKERTYPKHPANINLNCCRYCWGEKGEKGFISLKNFKYK